jgi:nucleoid-associated protein YgaU
MNKEAKIGLTIILVLLIIFVAVLAKRLYTSHTGEQSIAAEDKSGDKSESLANLEKEIQKKAYTEKTIIASTGQPTVVAATAVSGKPPQGSARDGDLWNMASDSGGSNESAKTASDIKSPPSYMPGPPRPGTEDRYRRYNTSDTSAATDDRYGDTSKHVGISAGAGRTYIVTEGDSLFDIARCKLGKASRWVEIYELNADVLGKDVECLVQGTQIVLPDEQQQMARPPGHRSRTID